MSNRDTQMIAEGNVVRDVELLFGEQSGNAYTRNAIAIERRRKDGDDWVSDTTFLDFTILDDRLAHNFVDSITKGDRILVVGDLRSRTVEDGDEKRTFYGLIVDMVGPSLRWATAAVTRNEKGSGTGKGGDFFDDSDF